MLVATFDIGTTAVKAVAVRDDGELVFTGSQVIHTIEKNGFKRCGIIHVKDGSERIAYEKLG